MGNQNQNKGNVKLMFDVMPQGMSPQKSEHQQAETMAQPEGKMDSAMPPVPTELQGPTGQSSEIQPSRSHIKLLIIGLVVVILGVGGYFGYMWWQDRQSETEEIQAPPTQPTGLSSAFLQKYFGSNLCNDETSCGITADPDDDKLTNEEEAEALTSPLLVDSDFDGLADGDEIKVYSTDPIVADTDGDGFEDGLEVRNGFSAIVESDKPAAQIELSIIQENIAKFPLHEYTTIFLGLENFKTNFGSEDTSISQLSIGVPQNFKQDMTTINPLIWNNTTASSTLVLSRSIVSATSTTESLVDEAVAFSQKLYVDLMEVSEVNYSVDRNDAIKKYFTFTDQGEQYRMDVLFLRSNTVLLTAASIVPTRLWEDEGITVEAMLNSLRAGK